MKISSLYMQEKDNFLVNYSDLAVQSVIVSTSYAEVVLNSVKGDLQVSLILNF